MEITVDGVCGQFRKSDRWVLPTFFGPGAPGRTWEKNAPDLRDLFALRIEEARADQAAPYSPPIPFVRLLSAVLTQTLKSVPFSIVYGPAKPQFPVRGCWKGPRVRFSRKKNRMKCHGSLGLYRKLREAVP